jgi:hypothetical protein
MKKKQGTRAFDDSQSWKLLIVANLVLHLKANQEIIS